MSEIGETFAALREHNRQKKQDNLAYSTQLLVDCGVVFETRNNGVHLIVSHAGKVVDFWPSTGKFIFRTGVTGRGVRNLLKLLGVRHELQERHSPEQG